MVYQDSLYVYQVARHACTFWIKLFTGTRNNKASLPDQIQVLVPTLVGVLLPRLKVPDEYAEFSESEKHDVSIEDSLEDIQFAISQRSVEPSVNPTASALVSGCDLRRTSASALDAIASMWVNELLFQGLRFPSPLMPFFFCAFPQE